MVWEILDIFAKIAQSLFLFYLVYSMTRYWRGWTRIISTIFDLAEDLHNKNGEKDDGK